MTDKKTTPEQAVSEIQDTLKRKLNIAIRAGNFQSFAFNKAQSEVAMLLLFKEIKESGEHKGIPYVDENGEDKFTNDMAEFCKFILGQSKSSLYEKLQNLETFGQDFFERSVKLGLGSKDMRLLRQSSTETQQLLLNNEDIDLSNKEQVEEFFEELNFKQVTEKAELQKKLDEANDTVEAAREISAETQQELNKIKELEAKRRFSQEPWKQKTMDSAAAIMKAKVSIEQGLNQLGDVYLNLSGDESLDEKSIALIARSLLTEALAAHSRINNFANEVFGVLGSKYSPDISAEDTFFDLQYEDVPAESTDD